MAHSPIMRQIKRSWVNAETGQRKVLFFVCLIFCRWVPVSPLIWPGLITQIHIPYSVEFMLRGHTHHDYNVVFLSFYFCFFFVVVTFLFFSFFSSLLRPFAVFLSQCHAQGEPVFSSTSSRLGFIVFLTRSDTSNSIKV